jgi:hypothetical protein
MVESPVFFLEPACSAPVTRADGPLLLEYSAFAAAAIRAKAVRIAVIYDV